MAGKTWTLTDVERSVYTDEIRLLPGDVGGAAQGYTVNKRRLRGGLRDGVDVVEVDNGLFSFVLVLWFDHAALLVLPALGNLSAAAWVAQELPRERPLLPGMLSATAATAGAALLLWVLLAAPDVSSTARQFPGEQSDRTKLRPGKCFARRIV